MTARKKLPEEVRRAEILNACDRLYREKGFREITIKDISQETSFSRPSIYNYFETKEEIFLGLLTREYKQWTGELNEIEAENIKDTSRLSDKIAESLENRKTLLKITSMNLYEIEDASRLERLREFKKQFRKSVESFLKCIRTAIPGITDQELERIRYAFFPFMYGIYPYVYPTEKQMEAMDQEGISYGGATIRSLVKGFLDSVLPQKNERSS